MTLRCALFDLDNSYQKFLKEKIEYKNNITKNLNVREYECPNCHNKLDRDFNASVNIMFEGLRLYTKELLVYGEVRLLSL